MTQVDRAIAALLEAWLSPRQLTAASGRANPNGLIRDARAEAARRGLMWREMWVRSAETGCKYKMHHLLAERTAGMRRNHERVSATTPSPSGSDTLAGDPQGRGTGGDGERATPTEHPSPGPETNSEMARRVASRSSSPSRRKRLVGVSGAARATGGAQRRLL